MSYNTFHESVTIPRITGDSISELDGLWTDILGKHWRFVESDENLEKIERRKEFEALLRKYLCIVPHDRKFFLPETDKVLKGSLKNLRDFSAYKAAMGFESISQYANNLFTKPWRKEYKVIKMYSGFYQHEIKTNLHGAEKLFEAMGYKVMPNQTLVLEGAICPDQVTNVSRDAIIACEECHIMAEIYEDVAANTPLQISWPEVYAFRENHIANTDHSVKQMLMELQEKQQKKPTKILKDSSSCYNNVQQLNCNSCNMHPAPQTTYCNPAQLYGTNCSIHGQPTMPPFGFGQGFPNFCPPTMPPQHPASLAALPHSKSLDQYQEPNLMYNMNNNCFQRHSVDFGGSQKMAQSAATGYDCVDNMSCNNYMNCNTYNVSGNRYPLPYNLSANFTNLGAPSPYLNGGPAVAAAAACNHGQYYSSNQPYYQQRNSILPTPSSNDKIRSSEIYMNQNFDHSLTNGSKKKHHDNNSVDYDLLMKMQNHHIMCDGMKNEDLIYIDTREEAKKTQKRGDPYKSKVDKLLHDYKEESEKHARTSRHSDFDSYDEFPNSQRRHSHVSNKNKEGIGSYESWNYVFQNLEQQGYTKDLGERCDIRALDEIDHVTEGTQTYLNGHEREHKTTKVMKSASTTRSNENKLKTLKSAEKVDGIKSSTSRTLKKVSSSASTKLEKPSNGILVKKKSTTFDLSQPSEWNCKHCTFLNTNSLRICEMCSKSKDFALDGSIDNGTTAACV